MNAPLIPQPTANNPMIRPEWLDLVERYLRDLRFGQIVLTVHQGDVIQVECTERVRFESRRKT